MKKEVAGQTAIPAGQYSYQVMVERGANQNGWSITHNSASSFTIISSNGADTDTVLWMAIGN